MLPFLCTTFSFFSQAQEDRNRLLAYPFADVVLICFDMSRKESLEGITEKWLVEINHHCHNNPPCFLVGLKSDLDNVVAMSDVQAIQSANPQCTKIFTLSAKADAAKVKELFNEAISAGDNNKKKGGSGDDKGHAGKQSGPKSGSGGGGGGARRRGCTLL